MCNSQNKQRFFPYTTSAYFISKSITVFCEVENQFLHICRLKFTLRKDSQVDHYQWLRCCDTSQ
jgi:hypothetical protein